MCRRVQSHKWGNWKKKVKLTGRSWRCCVSCNRRSSRQGGRKKGREKDIDFKYWFLFAFYSQSLPLNLFGVYTTWRPLLRRTRFPAYDNYDFSFVYIFLRLRLHENWIVPLSLSLAGEMFSAKKLKFSANSCLSSLLQLSSRLSRSMDDGWCMVLSMPNAIAITVRKKKKTQEWKVHMKEKNMSNICENKRRNPHVHVKKNEKAHTAYEHHRCALVKFAVSLTHGFDFYIYVSNKLKVAALVKWAE